MIIFRRIYSWKDRSSPKRTIAIDIYPKTIVWRAKPKTKKLKKEKTNTLPKNGDDNSEEMQSRDDRDSLVTPRYNPIQLRIHKAGSRASIAIA